MAKISSSRKTAKATPGTHIKTEPCPVDVSDSTSSELHQIKQEPRDPETCFMPTGTGNAQPHSTLSTKTEPDCVPVNGKSSGVKAEPEIHDVVNSEVHFPLKKEEEEEEDVKRVKPEMAEEQSDLRQDEEAGNLYTTLKSFSPTCRVGELGKVQLVNTDDVVNVVVHIL